MMDRFKKPSKTLQIVSVLGILLLAALATNGTVTQTATGAFSTVSDLGGGAAPQTETTAEETSNVNLQQGLQGYWRFDDPEVSRGHSLEFDGQDDYIEFGSPILPNGSFSISTWVKTNNKSGDRTIAGNLNGSAGAHLDLAQGDWKFLFQNPGNSPLRHQNAQENEWRHITGTYNLSSEIARLYVDGELSETSYIDYRAPTNSNFRIGLESHGDWKNYWSGNLDDIRVYRDPLSSRAVETLYRERDYRSKNSVTPISEYSLDSSPDICILNQGSLSDGGWGSSSYSELSNGLRNQGWNTKEVQVGDITQDGWKECDVIIFPNSERYPAFDKSEDFCSNVNGEGSEHDVFFEMKEFMNNGGMWVGTSGAGLWYAKAWDGNSWVDYTSCSQYSGDSLYKDGGGSRCSDIGYSCYTGKDLQYTNVNASVEPALQNTITSAPNSTRWASNLDINVIQGYDGSSPVSGAYIGIERFGDGYYFHPGGNYVFNFGSYSSAPEAWNNLLTWYAGNGRQKLEDKINDNNIRIETTGNDPVLTAGLDGSSVSLDGQNDYLRIPHSSDLNITDQLTVSAWAKISESPDDNDRLIQKAPENSVWLVWASSSDEKWRWRVSVNGNTHTITGPKIKVGEWSHIVAVWDGSNEQMQLFIDGELVGEKNNIGAKLDTSSRDITIGSDRGSDNFWPGKVDQVEIYNKALSKPKIRNLRPGKPIPDDELIFHQNFNLGPERCNLASGEKCLDGSTSNQITGTPTGFENNLVNNDSGWSLETPLNFPRIGDYSTRGNPGKFYNGEDGPLINFDFNESSGWSEGKVDENSLKFDERAYVDVPSGPNKPYSPENLQEYTLSLWAKRNGSHDGEYTEALSIGCYDTSFTKSSGDSMTLQHYTNDGFNAVSAGQMPKNKWIHYTGVWTGSEARIYKNGEMINSKDLNSLQNDSNQVEIGHMSCTSLDRAWSGKIDDVRIYNEALPTEDVKEVYNGKIESSGLVGRWNFESGEGDIAYDTSATENQGVLGTISPYFRGDSWTSMADKATDFGNRSFSLSYWIKPKDLEGNQYLVSKRPHDTCCHEFVTYLDNDTLKFMIYNGNSWQKVSSNVYSREWQHVVAQREEDGDMELFIDSELKNQSADCPAGEGPNSCNVTNQGFRAPLSVGADTRDGDAYFNGSIDELRIYNRSLSDRAVERLAFR